MDNMTPVSESPTSLHPNDGMSDSFEFPPSSSTASSPSKKAARRQTAVYPNTNAANKPQKPFSRSAAKRESVMALGSIEYLQHYFTKSGIAAKQNPLKPNSGLRPALGGTGHKSLKPSLGMINEFNLPPSPAIPIFKRSPYPQVEKTYETDPENLKPGVISDLQAVCSAWCLNGDEDGNRLSVDKGKGRAQLGDELNVLATLKTTTKLIRSVRNYVVSLPDEAGGGRHSQTQTFRAPTFSAPMLTRRSVSNPTSSAPSSPDPLARIRKSAIEVLSVLRVLEETARLPLTDDAYDAQSDRISSQDTGDGSVSPGFSPARSPARSPAPSEDQSSNEPLYSHGQDSSFAISVLSIPGRSEAVSVWAEEDDVFADLDVNQRPREIWDDRLVLGSGWLYRRDITLEGLTKEREVISRYLDTVDEVLFGGSQGGKRGWEVAAMELDKETERGVRQKVKGGRRSSHGNASSSRSPERDLLTAMNGTGISLNESMNNLSISEESTSEVLNEIEEEEEEEEGDGSSIDDDRLPEWAKRFSFPEDPLARAHALMVHLLPIRDLPLLPSPYSRLPQCRKDLLNVLSSGQLLCTSYNIGVRRSRKPWGYIDKDSIHDIATLEANASTEDADGQVQPGGDRGGKAEKKTKGWTFRRTDNLRLWAAALKLRYLIPLITPPSSSHLGDSSKRSGTPAPPASSTPTPAASPGPTATGFPGLTTVNLSSSISAPAMSSTTPLSPGPAAVVFDAKVVARKDEGWEEMLETVLLRWVDAVVEEKRQDH